MSEVKSEQQHFAQNVAAHSIRHKDRDDFSARSWRRCACRCRIGLLSHNNLLSGSSSSERKYQRVESFSTLNELKGSLIFSLFMRHALAKECLIIELATVADSDNDDFFGCIIDHIANPPVANPNPPHPFFALYLDASRWARLIGKCHYRRYDAILNRPVQPLDVFLSPRSDRHFIHRSLRPGASLRPSP